MPRPTPTTLTPRQQKIYDFIVAFKREHDGNAPTIREIARAAGYKTTSTTNYHLQMLERLGKISFQAEGRSRMIVVIGGEWTPPTPAGK
jgi:SOS-response transcriptional repressor LexA